MKLKAYRTNEARKTLGEEPLGEVEISTCNRRRAGSLHSERAGAGTTWGADDRAAGGRVTAILYLSMQP